MICSYYYSWNPAGIFPCRNPRKSHFRPIADNDISGHKKVIITKKFCHFVKKSYLCSL